MRQSKIFTKTEKNVAAEEISRNAQLLIQAGMIDKLMAGVFTLLPLGLKVCKKIEKIIREEINAIGGQELFMPTLNPKENWVKTGRWDSVDDLFKLPVGEGKELALAPTHEEIVVPIAKKFINSYKDLPVSVYHFQNKFRNEKRAKSGLLRGREFIMKDLYSFHLNQESLDEFYETVKKAYEKIFQRAGIGEKTYLTYAGGGSFSKYSHEFQCLADAGEDLIYICEKCRVAVNKEILADQQNKCPECGNENLVEKKAIEVGNIFKLGTKFSAPFDLAVMDANGNRQTLVMGCYGIGLQRLMGTVVEIHHDEKGIIWPESVAPFGVHLISLGQNEVAEKIYAELEASGVEVLFDDREVSAGEKFADADLIGVPIRLVVSKKSLEQGGVELKLRKEKESAVISLEEVKKRIIKK